MNILDENILNDQKLLLKMWKIPVHQIGDSMGWKGMQDEEIIPLLHRLNRPTLQLSETFVKGNYAEFESEH